MQTLVMAEGRRMMRLSRDLSPPVFGALINEYQRLLRNVMEQTGGRQFEVSEDTAIAAFPTPKDAAFAAAALQQIVATHEWPHNGEVAISVGVHSEEEGIDWLRRATIRCEALCDAAESGQIFLSSSTAALLEDEDVGDLTIRDLGERVMRRSWSRVHAFELLSGRTVTDESRRHFAPGGSVEVRTLAAPTRIEIGQLTAIFDRYLRPLRRGR